MIRSGHIWKRIFFINIFRLTAKIFLPQKIKPRIICFFIIAVITFFFQPGIYSFYYGGNKILGVNSKHYLSSTIILKLKNQPSVNSSGSVNLPVKLFSRLSRLGLKEAELMFPNKINEKKFGLGRIIVINFSKEIDPIIISKKVRNFTGVEWAEPKYVQELAFVPNDPHYSSQWNLSIINAENAWDISQGDTNVVIGIVDTGIDWDHPDLAANIWINRGEIPNNGIDDDGNGYIDDVRGWDFGGTNGTPDNDPKEDAPIHGTHVAGIASAVTNNGTGIASIGFKSKIMAVKTSIGAATDLAYGYEGIVYAADNGAKIINCSWGNNSYSILAQEIINYAISKGALIVAAAGNDNSSLPFYPAAYEGVLSVAATTISDIKASYSNFGYTIDVSAPGGDGINPIYSTWEEETYTTLYGTSMAAPLVSGLAALVTAHFPNYSPLQVGEQIRVNCDNINAQNPNYIFLLGRGRINAYKTLDNSSSESVRAIDINFSDDPPGGNGDGVFQPGETISVGVKFRNYLSSTSNLMINLQSESNYAVVDNGTFNVGSVATLDSFDNYSSRFTFTISNSIPQNQNLPFLLNYDDGNYTDFQWISTIGNPNYANQSGNRISVTLTSKGTLGFNDYPSNMQGDGFHFKEQQNGNFGSNLLFEGALILGTSSTQISDEARGADANYQDTDFNVLHPFILSVPGNISDQQGQAIFNDDGAGSSKIGIKVRFRSYSFADPPYDDFIVLRYTLTNETSSNINNLHAGIFTDWDFIDGDGSGDTTSYDPTGNFGFAYHKAGNPNAWIATALISSNNYGFYAINNRGDDGDINIYDGFSDSEKWQTISSGLTKLHAGGLDISNVTSGGPYNIAPGQSVDVAFAIAGGLNLSDLRTAVQNAKSKYQLILLDVKNESNNLPDNFDLSQNYPNPFNPTTKINYSVPKTSFVTIKVYNVLGKEVAELVNAEKHAGEYNVQFSSNKLNLASGVYFYRMRAVPSERSEQVFVETKKLILLK